ncbi:MAG: hypothetical protein KY466_05790 [Gemmatimonadetes bacterium]|nr:hypothetical protein [Gemmatimonadota bacterium]
MYRFRYSFPAPVLLSLLLLAGCSDTDAATEPLQPEAVSLASSGPVLIECPVATDTATTGMIDATGGAVLLNRHALRLPLLAVSSPTPFELRAPVSNYMELSVRGDQKDSFSFNKPVSITIDYSRCTRTNIDHGDLTVWQIDPVTKALLEPMGGVDDKVARTVTFETDHLSTYSLAR